MLLTLIINKYLKITLELKIERIGQRVVKVQCLQEFGCQTGMPGSTWCANDHVVLHIYGPKWFHRTWDESNRSSDCGVEASAIIWVPVVMPGRTQQANDHVTEHLFFSPPYFSLERQGTTNRHARWLWLCHKCVYWLVLSPRRAELPERSSKTCLSERAPEPDRRPKLWQATTDYGFCLGMVMMG